VRGARSGAAGATLARKVASRQSGHPASTLTRRLLLIDAAIALVVFAASVALLALRGAKGGDVDALGVLLAALASLPLVARRVAPLAVFVLTAAASTALYGIYEPAGPPIGPTLALYWLAAGGEESRARSLRDLAIVVLLLAAHATAGGLARGAFPGTEMLFGVLLWGGTWLAGDRTRMRRERMAALEERALRAEREAERERRLAAAEERGRIARDLHDSAGHAINTILVHAGLGRLQTERDPDTAREAFQTIEELARETVGEIDQMVRVLREDPSPSGEVEPPPRLGALDGLVERHTAAGLRVAPAPPWRSERPDSRTQMIARRPLRERQGGRGTLLSHPWERRTVAGACVAALWPKRSRRRACSSVQESPPHRATDACASPEAESRARLPL
jgi:signal transduction histidine kinase